MLASLTIQDFVLIDRLAIDLDPGFTVVTGETGAGKSVILGAIGLVTGARGDKSMVKPEAKRATVTAIFELDDGDPVRAILDEQGIEIEDQLMIRRTLSSDGKSRSFVNDAPVTLGLLKEMAGSLIEIHGQFDAQTITKGSGQRGLLDAFGIEPGLLVEVGNTYDRWRDLSTSLEALEASIRKAGEDEAYLRHQLDELTDLAAMADEEDQLAEQRSALMHAEKLHDALASIDTAIRSNDGITAQLSRQMRQLERLIPVAERTVEPVVASIDRVLIELGEAERAVDDAQESLQRGPAALEEIENRLFQLRDAARKYRVRVAELPELLEQTKQQIADIDRGGERLDELRGEQEQAKADYGRLAQQLSEKRHQAASRLEASIMTELPDLKLEKARFQIAVQTKQVAEGGHHGLDWVGFEVAINPGQPFSALERTASGGERSRILLAIKAALGDAAGFSTMIFDEIDTGLGGATADAVGERLGRLAQSAQVIVISHAPQVAARAGQHLHVAKSGDDDAASISLTTLNDDARQDELARMLAGAKITDAARAAAKSLLAGVP